MNSTNPAVVLGLVMLVVGGIVLVVYALLAAVVALWHRVRRHWDQLKVVVGVGALVGGGIVFYRAAYKPNADLAPLGFWGGFVVGLTGLLLLVSCLSPVKASADRSKLAVQRLTNKFSLWAIVNRRPIFLVLGVSLVLFVCWGVFPALHNLVAGAAILMAGILIGIHYQSLFFPAAATLRGLKSLDSALRTLPARLRERKQVEPALNPALTREGRCEYSCISGYIDGDNSHPCTSQYCLWADLVRSTGFKAG